MVRVGAFALAASLLISSHFLCRFMTSLLFFFFVCGTKTKARITIGYVCSHFSVQPLCNTT